MKKLITILTLTLTLFAAQAQVKLLPRFSYITSETDAQILVKAAGDLSNATLSVDGTQLVKQGSAFLFPADKLNLGNNIIAVQITDVKGDTTVNVNLVKLESKNNSVKIDYLTGEVITADDMPFMPCGFYCYSPIQPTLLEEEVVKGFNLYSPYQKVLPETRAERIAYMDRAAELGMKVNYNLLSVAGGGGVGSAHVKSTREEKWKALRDEISALKDHPALLSWYIADEPDGQGVEPELLEEIYGEIKAIDPYHPIAVVIMSASVGRKYAGSADIIMCDHYPIPNSPAKEVISAVAGLTKELYYEKAIWFVPQTFGGGEWWLREPTAAEIRMSIWGTAIAGARGYQAFVRHGLNAFPKNQTMWAAYAKACQEVQLCAPLLSSQDNETIVVNDDVIAHRYIHQGRELIVVVNKENKVAQFDVASKLGEDLQDMFLPFSYKQSEVKGMLNPFEVKVLLAQKQKENCCEVISNPSNMQYDYSFENVYSIASHQPSATYIGVGKDKGANYFLDSRTFVEGNHSLRVITPKDSTGVNIGLFPLPLQVGKSYIMTFWAKTDEESMRNNPQGVIVNANLGRIINKNFKLTDKWTKFELSAAYENSVPDPRALGSSLKLMSQGVAWFDMVEIVPDMNITVAPVEGKRAFLVTMNNNIPGGVIHYTTDGTEPTTKSKIYTEPVEIDFVCDIEARVYLGDKTYGITKQRVAPHKAMSASVEYITAYTKYTGGGDGALVDGLVATLGFKSPQWQGYIDNDMEVIIDLGKSTKFSRIVSQYLLSSGDWIAPPTSVEYSVSNDKQQWDNYGVVELGEAKKGIPNKIIVEVKNKVKARYIKVKAIKHKQMPQWHVGGDAWMFVDEIIVD